MIAKIKELYEYRDMILGLVKRDLRGRYKGSVLGFAWNFITPLCQIVVYYVIFSYVFRSGIDNFQVYLVTGMIPWNFFSEAIVQGTGSIVSNADMTKKIYFPREVIPIATVTSRFINMLLSMLIVFAVVIFSGIKLSALAITFIPIVMIIQYVMANGFVLLLVNRQS